MGVVPVVTFASEWRRSHCPLLIGHPGHDEVLGTLGHAPAGTVPLVSTPEEARRVRLPAGRPGLRCGRGLQLAHVDLHTQGGCQPRISEKTAKTMVSGGPPAP